MSINPRYQKCLVIILLFVIALPALADSYSPDIAPQARAIFQQCAKRYAALNSYQDKTDVSVETQKSGGKETTKSQEKIVFQSSPLMLWVDYIAEDPAKSMTTLIESESMQIYQKRGNTPTVWQKKLAGINFGRKVLLERPALTYTFSTFLAGLNPLESQWQPEISSLKMGTPAVVDGVSVYNIKAIYRMYPKESTTLLIGQKDMLIRGIRFINVDKNGVITTTIEMHHDISTDSPITESTFDLSVFDLNIKYDLDSIPDNSVLKIGQPFPTIKGFDFKGDNFDLATYKGKVLLIYFWASWCPACRYDIPYMKMLYKKYHSRGMEIIGISEDMTGRSLQAYIDDAGIPWINLYDIDNKLKQKNNVPHIPYSVLIGTDGNVHSLDLQRLDLEAQVVEVLKQPK